MITYSTAISTADLNGILKLQKANLPKNISAEESRSQGFVTVDHSFEQLKKLNDFEKHVIAKDGENVVGYLLAMTRDCRNDIPILIPMFNIFDKIGFGNKTVSEYNYLVVGQVCVDKGYRGQGILDKCYKAYKEHYGSKYDFAITEIALTNTRSLRAHEKNGFKQIHSYKDPANTEWVVVIWDWK